MISNRKYIALIKTGDVTNGINIICITLRYYVNRDALYVLPRLYEAKLLPMARSRSR